MAFRASLLTFTYIVAHTLFIRSHNVSPDTDRELVLKYRNSHESKYIGELFERYTHLVFGVGMKYLKDQEEARDMVMEVFEKLLTELKKHNVKNFKAWIHTVAKNYCLMKLRKEEPGAEFMKESKKIEAHLMENPTIEHLNSEEELYEAVDKAMEELGEEQKKCIQLFYFENKTYQQIVDDTGYDLNDVKSHLQNGKRNLKNTLEGKERKNG